MIEVAAHSVQCSNVNHFQRKKIVNLTHGIITEGKTANLQFRQSLTVSQIEVTIWILGEVLVRLSLREAVFSDYDFLQLCQPNHLYFLHILKGIITHSQLYQIAETTEINRLQLTVIATPRINHKHTNAAVNTLQLLKTCYNHSAPLPIHSFIIYSFFQCYILHFQRIQVCKDIRE